MNGKNNGQRIIDLAHEEQEYQMEIKLVNTIRRILYRRVRNYARKQCWIAQIAAREARKQIKLRDISAITKALRTEMVKLDASIKTLLNEAAKTQEVLQAKKRLR